MLAPGLDEILTGASWRLGVVIGLPMWRCSLGVSVLLKSGVSDKISPRSPYQSLQHPTRLGPFPRGRLTHGPPASHHSSESERDSSDVLLGRWR